MARRTTRTTWVLPLLLLLALVAAVLPASPTVQAQEPPAAAQVQGRAWVDANFDGFQGADEPGFGPMEIELWSVTPLGEPFEAVAATTSDGLGRYELGAPPGDYRVRAILPDADAEFALTGIADEQRNSDIVAQGDGTGLSEVVTLAADVAVTELDIGINWPSRPPSLPTLRSSVWHDVDRNGGFRGEFDRPLPRVGVQVRSFDDLLVADLVTNANGAYELPVAPGTYRSIYTLPDGFAPTIDSQLDAEFSTPAIELEPGSILFGGGVGLIGPGANVFGEVFFDTDGNGARDPSDALASNIGVDLLRDGQLVDTMFTEAGQYGFLGVDPSGSYQIRMFGRPDLAWSGPDLDADGRSAEFAFDASGVMRIDAGLAEPLEERVITFTSPRSLPEGTFALLTVDDVSTAWDFSPVDVLAPLGQELIIVIDLEPDGSWALPTVTCTEGVSAQLRTSASPPYAYWQVTRTGIDGPHSCSVDADYFFDESIDVVISVEAPAEYGAVPVGLTWFPDVGGAFVGKVAVPGSPVTFRVPALPGSAEWSYYEDSALEPIFSCDLVDPVASPLRDRFEFDLSGLEGMTVNCTITLVEPMPETATVTYTKVAPDLDVTFEVSSFGDLAPGESVTLELPIPVRLSERLPDGFDLVDVVCTDGVWTETFVPRSPSSTFLSATLNQATAGSTINCTSTSVLSTEDAELVIDRVGPPGTTLVELDAPGSPTFELDDTITIRAEAELVELLIEPPIGQRFVQLSCGNIDVTRTPGTGRVSLRAPSGRTDCTLTTEAAENPPVEVHLRTVLPVGADEVPDVYIYDGAVDAFPAADGAVITHRLGTGDLSGVRFNTIASSPWELSAVTCTGDVAVSLRVPASGQPRNPRATIGFGDGVQAGDRIDCNLEMVRLASVPLRIELAGAPADLEIPVRVDDVPVGTTSSAQPLVRDVAIDRESYAIFEAGRVGYVATTIDCDYPWAGMSIAGPNGAILLLTVQPFSIPDEIVCTVQVAPANGSRLVVRTEVEGAEGNGSFRFEVEHGYAKPEAAITSGMLSQRDAQTFQLVADRVLVRPFVPPGWEAVDVSCSAGSPELLADGSVLLFLALAAPVECVFTNRLVNPDELGVPGDANCDSSVDIIDALVIAQFDAFVRSGAAACPLADAATELFTGAADFDGSGGVDILDALQVARCTVGLPAPPCAAAFEFD